MKKINEPPTHIPNDDALISHRADSRYSYGEMLAGIRSRLREAGDLPGATVDQQISLLDDLSSVELGRFLLENRGLNAHWTHRLVTYRPGSQPAGSMSALEHRIFETLPAVLATRERFGIFRQQLQALLKSNLVLASVPCGFMGDLLLLDYERHADIAIVGIDLDHEALDGALVLAKERGLAERVSLRREDAWISGVQNEFDVLTSNGLNIYEPDDSRVIALYRSFFDALRPGGTLVTSFLTPPPTLSLESPWNLGEVDQESLALQHLMFVRIIEARWSVFRTHAQTMAQLESAGFMNIEFIDDRARMFPTVIARKSI